MTSQSTSPAATLEDPVSLETLRAATKEVKTKVGTLPDALRNPDMGTIITLIPSTTPEKASRIFKAFECFSVFPGVWNRYKDSAFVDVHITIHRFTGAEDQDWIKGYHVLATTEIRDLLLDPEFTVHVTQMSTPTVQQEQDVFCVVCVSAFPAKERPEVREPTREDRQFILGLMRSDRHGTTSNAATAQPGSQGIFLPSVAIPTAIAHKTHRCTPSPTPSHTHLQDGYRWWIL
jgi:hypothetical protein